MRARTFPVDVNDTNRVATNSELADETSGSRRMRVIPWPRIRGTLYMAKTRGNDRIIEVFLRALSDDALFDDRGAWCENKHGVSNVALINGRLDTAPTKFTCR
jgi:hypothetical protein